MRAVLYYRGKLSSCNYSCPYCPFSKTKDNRETLAQDKRQLETFIGWIRAQEEAGHRLALFFNPYGEALIHRWYREAMIELSELPHIEKVAIQTNLSCRLDWTERLNRDKAAFWITYHPGQTSRVGFLSQCMRLYEQGISFSVGTVGVRSAFDAIEEIRRLLPEDVYVWVNAYKDQPDYYTAEEVKRLQGVDPYFAINLRDYDSLGRPCAAGETVFYVQGSGIVKRCYQDRRVIGHLYRDGLEGLAAERACGMKNCGCYIGYIHMPELELNTTYAGGLLERIPMRHDSMRKEGTTIV
ncbi:STM4011 family radical SAM protein [Paenibacillus thiaminolyticus]|uniref:STM4011 family radical SAM protein n=1 Tax=Paenibacillus thiaminolyticus TaxID=49283 RepID=UPI003D28EC20